MWAREPQGSFLIVCSLRTGEGRQGEGRGGRGGKGRRGTGGEGRGGGGGELRQGWRAGWVLSRTSVARSAGCCDSRGAPGWVPAHSLCIGTKEQLMFTEHLLCDTSVETDNFLSAQPASCALS